MLTTFQGTPVIVTNDIDNTPDDAIVFCDGEVTFPTLWGWEDMPDDEDECEAIIADRYVDDEYDSALPAAAVVAILNGLDYDDAALGLYIDAAVREQF